MDVLLHAFPHIAKDIFQFLDQKSLKNCFKVCKSWKTFLENEKFFWRRMTNGQAGWTELLNTMSSQTISALGTSFFAIQEYSDIMAEIHPIFCAIDLDDVELFKTLINLYPQFRELTLHKKTQARVSPFHFAAYKGKVSCFQDFIDGERNPKNSIGSTPLHVASRIGHFDIVKLILDSIKGEKNPQDNFDYTPLHEAIISGHLEIVKLILDSIEEEKNPQNQLGMTPLHFASRNGHLDIVRLLLDRNEGEKNPQNEYGNTPLHIASRDGHLDIVKLLLDRIEIKKNPKNCIGNTPLHHASINGHSKIVKLLLDHIKVKKNPRNRFGKTPLDLAQNQETKETIKSYLTPLARFQNRFWHLLTPKI